MCAQGRAPTNVSTRVLRPVVLPATLYVARPLQANVSRQKRSSSCRVLSSIEYVDEISKEEAAHFDRIAASLVGRLENVQDYVEGENIG